MIDYNRIPEHIKAALDRYVNEGLPPGHFLSMMLQFDIRAVLFADDLASKAIKDIFAYIFHELPQQSFGSVEAYHSWIESHKLRRLK